MTAEEEVRDTWNEVKVIEYPNDKPYWIHNKVEYMGTGPFRTTDEMWQAALDFTRKRQQEIAEIEEEMEWVMEMYDDDSPDKKVVKRILSRLTAQRDEIRKGMKGAE